MRMFQKQAKARDADIRPHLQCLPFAKSKDGRILATIYNTGGRALQANIVYQIGHRVYQWSGALGGDGEPNDASLRWLVQFAWRLAQPAVPTGDVIAHISLDRERQWWADGAEKLSVSAEEWQPAKSKELQLLVRPIDGWESEEVPLLTLESDPGDSPEP